MKQNKMWLMGLVGAAMTGVACLLPIILFVLFGSAVLAWVPPWLDYILVPAFLIFSSMAFTAWYRRKKLNQTHWT
ncbi:MAG: hypothetical protein IIA75_07600 [Proteobacteria bacterium]|nr:hypothetical protein [Pseudomonadota bacterium]MCH8257744.1 hypothetical protein [Pseudomonadota bacterium]